MKLINRLVNLILNNFAIFLLVISLFLLQNKIFLFKVSNNFNVISLEEKAFVNYLKHKKITFFTKKIERIKKDVLFKGIVKNNEKKEVFSLETFYKKLENYKSYLDFVYKMLGFSLLFLAYKFIRRIKL
jgi:hypothetical protein